MKKITLFAFAAIVIAIGLVGCEADEGSPFANRTPSARFTVAPNNGATVNHYLPLRWAGNDADGTVEEFYLLLDGDTLARTTARDTLIAFYAPENNTPTAHTIEIIAVDNEGLPANATDTASVAARTRSFFVVNQSPTAQFNPEGTITPASTVGKGFRITIAGEDPNPSFLDYSISLDDSVNGWTAWGQNAIFLFCDPAIMSDAATFPEHATGISNAGLTIGSHTIYAKVKDGGGASSPIASISFAVADGFAPTMGTGLTEALYAGSDIYVDGSAYYIVAGGTKTELSYLASAASYGSEINAYRERINGHEWNPWHTRGKLDTLDLGPGEYLIEFQARDLANTLSNLSSYALRLVQEQLSDSIIVVAATANGNGGPGSPRDSTVTAFYNRVLEGYSVRTISYFDTLTRGSVYYISPFDLQYAGLVIWHGDDLNPLKRLNENLPIISSFLSRGGRLLVSGWNVMVGFGTNDTLDFAAGSFGREYLHMFNAYQIPQNSRVVQGFNGANGYGGLHYDPSKLPGSFVNGLDRCWVFRQRGECTVAGTLLVNNPDVNPYANKTAFYIYDLTFRVGVFGIPLFFCQESEVYNLFQGEGGSLSVIDHMLEGLSPAF